MSRGDEFALGGYTGRIPGVIPVRAGQIRRRLRIGGMIDVVNYQTSSVKGSWNLPIPGTLPPDDPSNWERVMKRMVAGIALCALLSGQGVAQSPPSTADFVQKVAMSDMLEIQSSKLVQPKADRDTKPFAARMIKDHTKTSTELKRLVQSGKVEAELPTKLDEEHHSKLDELKNLGGKELDKAYDNMQVQAHQEAVELFTQYSQNGDNEDLKKWAAKTLPALKQHLRMAEKLK
jgi:putative membrane protein